MIQEALRLSHLKIDIQNHTIFSDLSLCLYPGETVCLPCLSAAQRDALCRALSGRLRPLSGCIFVNSSPAQLNSPMDALEKGVFCILRQSALFDNLSISENLFSLPFDKQPLWLRRAKMTEQTQKLLDQYAPSLLAGSAVAALAPFERHLVELIKAIYAKANVIVYDHDLSEYTETEYIQLASLWETLNRQGVSILCMSANLNRAAQIADRIIAVRKKTVLKAFQKPFSLPQITQCLLGFTEQEEWYAVPPDRHTGDALFSAQGMRVASSKYAFDLEIYAGEVVGIVDISHRIANDILDALAGRLPHWEQMILLNDVPVSLLTPEDSFRCGILLADRLSDSSGLFQSMTVEQNIQFPALRRTAGAACHIRKQFLAGEARAAAQSVGITEEELLSTVTPATVFRTQLARIRLSFCRLLLLRHPFSGLHLAEQNALRTFIRDYAAEGNGIAVAVSDARDLDKLCNRFYVITPQGLYEQAANGGTYPGGNNYAQNL